MSARLMAVINYRKVYREGWRGRGGGERGVKEEGKRADRGKHGDEEGRRENDGSNKGRGTETRKMGKREKSTDGKGEDAWVKDD